MRRARKSPAERLLESGGVFMGGCGVLILAILVLALVEVLLVNGRALVIGLVSVGGVLAVLKYLPGCVEKIHAVRDRRKQLPERPEVKVLGFTADDPPTRALRRTDARRGP